MGGRLKLLLDRLNGNEFWLKLAKNVSTIVVGQGGAPLRLTWLRRSCPPGSLGPQATGR